jgi:intron-binding protein aquarius
MALPVREFSITNVGKPKLGEEKPSEVNAEIKFSIEKVMNKYARNEWDALKLHDVLFLVTLRPKLNERQEIDTSLPFLDQVNISHPR